MYIRLSKLFTFFTVAPLLATALLGVTMGQIPTSIIERLAVARLLRKVRQNVTNFVINTIYYLDMAEH